MATVLMQPEQRVSLIIGVFCGLVVIGMRSLKIIRLGFPLASSNEAKKTFKFQLVTAQSYCGILGC